MQTPEQAILERISISRGTSDPAPAETTENTEVVNVSEDTKPIENEAETEAVANEEVEQEIEESENEEVAQVTSDDESEDLYVDYKGREINLKDVEEWEQGHLRQSDYTRKTQELADSRKDFESKQADFTAKESTLNDKLLAVEAMLKEDSKTPEQLAEMREYEPEEYIRYTEKQVKVKEFIDSSKQASNVQNVDKAQVSAELFAAHPEWMDNGKNSKRFIADAEMMDKYAKQRGLSYEHISNYSSAQYEVLLDAARYKQQSASNAAIEKKVRKAPVTTKPRAAARAAQSDYDKAKKAFKDNPSPANAVALRKVQKPK